MKSIMIASAALVATALPVAAHAAPAATASAQAICMPAQTKLPDGSTVVGTFCYTRSDGLI